MGAQMSHREWYVDETYNDEDAEVGLGRIGIGIFNRERQPVCSEDGNLVGFLIASSTIPLISVLTWQQRVPFSGR